VYSIIQISWFPPLLLLQSCLVSSPCLRLNGCLDDGILHRRKSVTNFENFRNEKSNDHQMQNGETTATPTPRALFETIGQGAEEVNNIADDSEESQKLVEEIESIQGTTRLLLTKIPFFREVIIMSFSCPHCGTLLPLSSSYNQASPTRTSKVQDKFNHEDQSTHSKSQRKKTSTDVSSNPTLAPSPSPN
jgi:hypothetical protein